MDLFFLFRKLILITLQNTSQTYVINNQSDMSYMGYVALDISVEYSRAKRAQLCRACSQGVWHSIWPVEQNYVLHMA